MTTSDDYIRNLDHEGRGAASVESRPEPGVDLVENLTDVLGLVDEFLVGCRLSKEELTRRRERIERAASQRLATVDEPAPPTPRSGCPVVQMADHGGLVFGDVVSRVADSLSPLGAAARIVAEASALVFEFREIQLGHRDMGSRMYIKERRVDSAEKIRFAERHESASTALRQMRTQLSAVELSAESLRSALRNMQWDLLVQGHSREEMSYQVNIIQTLTTLLVQHHMQANAMIEAIDSVLNGAVMAVTAPAPYPGLQVPSRGRR